MELTKVKEMLRAISQGFRNSDKPPNICINTDYKYHNSTLSVCSPVEKIIVTKMLKRYIDYPTLASQQGVNYVKAMDSAIRKSKEEIEVILEATVEIARANDSMSQSAQQIILGGQEQAHSLVKSQFKWPNLQHTQNLRDMTRKFTLI